MIDKIIRKNKMRTIGQCPLGQLFLDQNTVFMKTERHPGSVMERAINQVTGGIFSFDKDTVVTLVRGHLTIFNEEEE